MKEDSRTKTTFITEARREQFIEAAIRTLDEIGYVNASQAQIAKRAGVSTALISYHFADKSDLMNQLLMNLVEKSASYIMDRVNKEHSAWDKLRAFITASLDYQSTHRARNVALIEIVFNARTPDNIPYYKLDEDDGDPVWDELKQILIFGQNNGEFGAFDVDVIATIIQGGIGEYMLSSGVAHKVDSDAYKAELIRVIERIVGK